MATTLEPAARRVTGGVDTHKDGHVAAALDDIGRLLGTAEFPADPTGYRQLRRWLDGFGDITAVGVEGTGSWGAGLSRALTAAGVSVIEVNRSNRQHRRRHGKSDPADAINAARSVLSTEATTTPKSHAGAVEAIRMLRLARRSAIKARTQAANQLHALVVTAPAELRQQLRSLTIRQLAVTAARYRVHTATDPTSAARLSLRCLARRWQHLNTEINELTTQLDDLTTTTAPHLRDLFGVGPDNAAVLLTAAGDNPHRMRSSGAFAALCGTTPVQASSGQRQRHRLNRGGNRQANSALYTIVITRLSSHEPTRAYMTRRLAQGRTRKEVIRCLKRYIANEVHRAITLDLT